MIKNVVPVTFIRPSAVLFDIGMTMIYPSGDVMVREILRFSPALTVDPTDAARAFYIAAEAHRWRNGTSRSPTEVVGGIWGYLLDLPHGVGFEAWDSCVRCPDLYTLLDPDATSVLRTLRSMGVKTAAVSNSNIPLRDELAAFGLLSLFDVSVGSEEGYPEKPAPDMFRIALEILNVDPSKAWHVGDGVINDVLGSCHAGVAWQVLVDYFGVHVNPPCICVRSMAELHKIVSEL